MMTITEKKNIRERFISGLIAQDASNEMYVDFVNYIFIKKGFINNVDLKELVDMFRYAEETNFTGHWFWSPFVSNNNFAFTFEIFEPYKTGGKKNVRFALDPKSCYNKPKHCSIQANFGKMSKREYKLLIQMLDKIFDTKSEFYRNWKKTAGCMWGSEFGNFGDFSY